VLQPFSRAKIALSGALIERLFILHGRPPYRPRFRALCGALYRLSGHPF
jgi:hypothetical protein